MRYFVITANKSRMRTENNFFPNMFSVGFLKKAAEIDN